MNRAELSIYLGVAFATTLGHTAITSLPFEVGAIADGLHLDSIRTGSLATAELMAYAFANLLIAPYAGKISTRWISVAGAVLVIIASLATGCVSNLLVFAIWRVLAGIGFGVIFASANVVGSVAVLPERAYACGLGASIVFFTVLPNVFAAASTIPPLLPGILLPHSSVFVAVAVFVALMLPTLGFLPRRPTEDTNKQKTTRVVAYPVQVNAAWSGAVVIVVALFALAVFSLYAFIERRARQLGMSAAEVGFLISASFGTGMIGTVGAGLLGSRAGLTWPITVSLFVQSASCLAVAYSTSHTQIYIYTIVFVATWYFVYPYIFGLAARIDPVGRLATAVGGVYLVGSSAAATVGGALVNSGGYPLVGWVACGLCISAAMVAFVVSRSLEKRSTKIAGVRAG